MKCGRILLTFAALVYASCLLPQISSGAAAGRGNTLNRVERWFILLDYKPENEAETLALADGFDMAVLDPDGHPPISGIKKDMILIAYVSLGEAERYRSYWENIKGSDWILGENPDWPENYFVDVRSKAWRKVILDEVLPDIISKGFDGIMMDTLDTAGMLEDSMPRVFGGSREAMIGLVREIDERYPDIFLISNNGFSILGKIAPYLDGALAEDIYMMIDFGKDGYKSVPADVRKYRISALEKVAKKRHVPVFIIDYAPSGDKKTSENVRKKIKALGFRPYMAEKELDRIYGG